LISDAAWGKTLDIQLHTGVASMAHSNEHDHASAMDYPAHEDTYHGFVHLLIYLSYIKVMYSYGFLKIHVNAMVYI
jgi:hypothetical protein